MRIKICGVTRLEDAQVAADLGAAFIGFIFVPESPRFIRVDEAAEIAARVHGPQFVGVFRDAPLEAMQSAPFDYVQLHGSESEAVVRALAKRVIKAIHVEDRHSCLSWPETEHRHSCLCRTIERAGVPVLHEPIERAGVPVLHEQPEWLLFDSKGGGTGRRFDWSLLAAYPRTKPFLLAGGITAENVAAAISRVRPDGIDVASGVESRPGIKDHQKLKQLFERAK